MVAYHFQLFGVGWNFLKIVKNSATFLQLSMRAPKGMPPILLLQPMTSETDVDSTAVEGEAFHQYCIMFCCCLTDSNRGQSKKMVLTWKCG